jgi:hypothetical protein
VAEIRAMDVYLTLLYTTAAPDEYCVQLAKAGTPEQLTWAAAGRTDRRASSATLVSSLDERSARTRKAASSLLDMKGTSLAWFWKISDVYATGARNVTRAKEKYFSAHAPSRSPGILF